MNETDAWTLFTILGLTVVTVLARTFFLIPNRALPMPAWVARGLQYAPIAALAAVVVPEVFMTQGELIGSWRDARPYAMLAALLWFARYRSVLGTILSGMAVYLPLHLGLGW